MGPGARFPFADRHGPVESVLLEGSEIVFAQQLAQLREGVAEVAVGPGQIHAYSPHAGSVKRVADSSDLSIRSAMLLFHRSTME